MLFLKLIESVADPAEILVSTSQIPSLVLNFATLILLVICIFLFRKVLNSNENTKNNKENKKENKVSVNSVSAAQQNPSMNVQDGIDDEIVAVITAAIAAISGGSFSKGFEIKSIKRSENSMNKWAYAGLLESTKPF